MDLNPVEVSAAVVTVLTPFIPYLVDAAKFSAAALAEMIVQKGGETAWQQARALWGKISDRYSEDGVVSGAATMLAAQPENEEFQTILTRELTLRLQEDQKLLQDIQSLIGGQEVVQKVLAGRSSWVENVTQEISGIGGTQVVKAKDDSVISGVKQSIKR